MDELMLYSRIDATTAEWLIRSLNWVSPDSVYSMRMYSPGGDVDAAWGIIAKMNELKQKNCHSIAKVDGMAASMAGIMLCFFDEREALDVSNIMLHRAAMPEKDEAGNKITLTAEDIAYLNKVNADLKEKMCQVIDGQKLKALKGVSIDDLFDEKKQRVNCWLSAEEAYQVGLITKVISLDASNQQYMVKAVAACYGETQRPMATAATAGNNQSIKMTAEEFKKQNPEAYAAMEKTIGESAVAAYKTANGGGEGSGAAGNAGAGASGAAVLDEKGVMAIVEKTLKSVGVNLTEGGQQGQTAQATAAQLAAQAEAKTKAEAETKKAVDDLASDLKQIVTGGKK